MALTRLQKAGWGLADFGVVVFNIVKQILVFAYMTSALGIPVGQAGAVTTGVLIFDLATDPVMGWISDRTRTRWGRRAPWMALGAPVMVIGMVCVFAVPPGPWAVIQVAAGFALASVGFTMVAVPYGAQAGEMTEDRAARSTMTAWRMGFASLGILLAGGVIPALAAQLGHVRAVLAVAPLIIGAIWGSLWLTRRAPRRSAPLRSPWRAQIGWVLANRGFVRLTVLYAVMTLGVAVMTAGMAFVALYLVQGQGALAGLAGALGPLAVLFAAFTLGALVAQPVWAAATIRIGGWQALSLGLIAYILLLLVIWARLPGALPQLAGLFVLGGICNGAYQQIPWALYPRHMDETRARSGQALEGAHSAVWLMGQKLANALGPLILGQVLAVAGWRATTQGVVAQSEAALAALRGAVTLLPAALLGVAVIGVVALYRPGR